MGGEEVDRFAWDGRGLCIHCFRFGIRFNYDRGK